MAGTKALSVIKSTLTKPAAKAVGRSADEVLNPHVVPGDFGPIDDLATYQKAQNELDAATDIPHNPREVQAEVARQEAENIEQFRQYAITSENKVPRFMQQARNPEEYKGRMEQFMDPEFSEEAAMHGAGNNVGDTSSGLKNRVKEKQLDWLSGSWGLTESQFKTGRYGSALRSWFGDGAYTRKAFGDTEQMADEPMVFYHVDSRTDPTARATPIQFEANAHEFGLHVGSQRAASDIGGGGLPTARQTMGEVQGFFKRFEEDLQAEFADVPDFNLAGAFKKAVDERQRAIFLRPGELPVPRDSQGAFNDVVDEMFEDMMGFLSFDGNVGGRARQALDQQDVFRFKQRMNGIMSSNYDSSGYPLVTNVQNGLHIPDLGNFSAENIAKHLEGMDIISDEVVQTVKQAGKEQANTALRDALREVGYDHIIYHNAAEDAGNVSLILFDERTMQNLYNPSLPRAAQSGVNAAQAVAMTPLLGIANGLVRED